MHTSFNNVQVFIVALYLNILHSFIIRFTANRFVIIDNESG